MRLLSILVLASVVSFPSLSCSWFCKNQAPPIIVKNQLPELKQLDRPELHEYTFKKLDPQSEDTPDQVFTITRAGVGDISSDLAALIDLINRYEELIDEYNKVREEMLEKGEESEPD